LPTVLELGEKIVMINLAYSGPYKYLLVQKDKTLGHPNKRFLFFILHDISKNQ